MSLATDVEVETLVAAVSRLRAEAGALPSSSRVAQRSGPAVVPASAAFDQAMVPAAAAAPSSQVGTTAAGVAAKTGSLK